MPISSAALTGADDSLMRRDQAQLTAKSILAALTRFVKLRLPHAVREEGAGEARAALRGSC